MKIFKMIIDILLLVLTILLESNEITGRLIHEILGIAMGVLLIIHIATNWRWIKSVSENFKKVNIKTKIMYIISILTFIIYFGAVIFGILVSNEIFKFKTMSNYKFVLTHIILGRLAIVIMLLHIGINLDSIFAKIKNKIPIYIIYVVIAVAVSAYYIYTLIHSFQWMMVFGGINF